MKIHSVQKRTIEFKAELTLEQQFKVDLWLEQLRAVWNRGLGELIKFDKVHWRDKQSKSWVARCYLPWVYRKYDDVIAPACQILNEQSYWYQKQSPRVKIKSRVEGKNEYGWENGIGYSCPIGEDYQECSIDGTSEYSLNKVGKTENIEALLNKVVAYQEESYQRTCEAVAYKYRQNCLKQLAKSWEEYVKSRSKQNTFNRGIPKFKNHRFPIKSIGLNNGQTKGVRPIRVTSSNEISGVPKLGIVKVKGLYKRWGNLPIKEFRIVKKLKGYYVQLMSDVPTVLKRNSVEKGCGIDPNVVNSITLDNGKRYDNYRYLRASEKHLKRLQQKLANKLSHRLILYLNNPTTNASELTDICKVIGLDTAQKLLTAKCKCDNDILEIISASTLNKIKYHVTSKNEQKLKNKIAKKHALIAAKRKANDDKITTYITRTYSHIALEDTTTNKMVKRLKAVEREGSNGYEQSGQKNKSQLNKAILDSSIGRKKELFQRKAKENERKIIKVNSVNSTLKCPVCGELNEPVNRIIKCKCGWTCDEDVSAGVNFALAMYDKKQIPYELLSDNSKRALREREGVKAIGN